MNTFAQYVAYFIIYAFLGRVWELLFCLYAEHRLNLQNFLTLPLLPIYGFSALGILFVVEPHVQNPFMVFLLAAAVVTLVELVTATVLEKYFKVKLWDYTSWPFNYKGRISLFSSLGFGVFGLFLVYVLHPFIRGLVLFMPAHTLFILSVIAVCAVGLDFANSLGVLFCLRATTLSQGVKSIQETLHVLDHRIHQLRRHNKPARSTFAKWHRYMLRRWQKAFPNARLLPNKRRFLAMHRVKR